MILPVLYDDYDRRAVHDLFEPETSFTPGAGTWGIRGTIRLKHFPGDFVLFVTFGKVEGQHLFDESISSEGILRWQTEPQQDLKSPTVQELLAHDETQHAVHLMLRTANLRGGVAPPFTYLGPLKYFAHDHERSQPAHIAWQLLEWPIPAAVSASMQLQIVPENAFAEVAKPASGAETATSVLLEEEPPEPSPCPGEITRRFKAMKRRYLSSDESRDLGLRGELLVLERERQRLVIAGRPDLADSIVHTSVIEGDGAGYDIRSYFADGRTKFIEVKTTTGPKSAEFLVSPNEVAFSAKNAEQFELCRVFGFDARTKSCELLNLWKYGPQICAH